MRLRTKFFSSESIWCVCKWYGLGVGTICSSSNGVGGGDACDTAGADRMGDTSERDNDIGIEAEDDSTGAETDLGRQQCPKHRRSGCCQAAAAKQRNNIYVNV